MILLSLSLFNELFLQTTHLYERLGVDAAVRNFEIASIQKMNVNRVVTPSTLASSMTSWTVINPK